MSGKSNRKKTGRSDKQSQYRRPDPSTATRIRLTVVQDKDFLADLLQRVRAGAEIESLELKVTLRNSKKSEGVEVYRKGIVDLMVESPDCLLSVSNPDVVLWY